MADDHRDEPLLTQDPKDNLEQSDDLAPAGEPESDSGNELLRTSMEDTGESSSLQEQEARVAQNNGAQTPVKSAPKAAPKPVRGTKEAAAEALRHYNREMNDYLTWKENLRLTSMDLQIGGPYFDLWTQEANLFFRRLVILRKRVESIKKQKRA
ncbi:MAG: hypothetical protein EOP07_06050 [Proteobacteria bacterium]|nr:MAG: hypothetical protein EOP07_06050 [Pseudomonadota bacterium]